MPHVRFEMGTGARSSLVREAAVMIKFGSEYYFGRCILYYKLTKIDDHYSQTTCASAILIASLIIARPSSICSFVTINGGATKI